MLRLSEGGAALRHQGIAVNNKKLRRLMREHDLQPKRAKQHAKLSRFWG